MRSPGTANSVGIMHRPHSESESSKFVFTKRIAPTSKGSGPGMQCEISTRSFSGCCGLILILMLCFILQFLYVLPRPIVAIARSEMTAIVLCPTAAQRTSDNGARVSLDQAFSASVCLRSGGAEARPVAYRRPPTDKPEADALASGTPGC